MVDKYIVRCGTQGVSEELKSGWWNLWYKSCSVVLPQKSKRSFSYCWV